MKVSARFIEIEKIVNERLEKYIRNLSHNIRNRIRVLFNNGAVLDIRYPIETEYSFNLRYKNNVYRIDTSPYHPDTETFPNHYHNKKEDNVINDRGQIRIREFQTILMECVNGYLKYLTLLIN